MDIGLRVRDAQTLERLAHRGERHRALTGGWPGAGTDGIAILVRDPDPRLPGNVREALRDCRHDADHHPAHR